MLYKTFVEEGSKKVNYFCANPSYKIINRVAVKIFFLENF